jgi:hypothetical protein
MSVNEQIGPLMAEDFANQNISRMQEWFSKFDDASIVLEKHLGDLCLKSAIQRNQWLNVAFLVSVDDLPRKKDQIYDLQENLQQMAPLLLKSLIHRRGDSQLLMMEFLQDRVRL